MSIATWLDVRLALAGVAVVLLGLAGWDYSIERRLSATQAEVQAQKTMLGQAMNHIMHMQGQDMMRQQQERDMMRQQPSGQK